MASLRVLGDWLDGSGWCRAIEESKVTSSGRADAMIVGKHVIKPRWAHRVTAAALCALQPFSTHRCRSGQPRSLSVTTRHVSTKTAHFEQFC